MGLRGKWFYFTLFALLPVKGQSQGALHGHNVGQTRALGRREVSEWDGREVELQLCWDTGAAERGWGCSGTGAFPAEPALLQEQDLHPHPAPLGHTPCPPGPGPACRTINPALLSSHSLGSCLGQPICSTLLAAPGLWAQLRVPLALPLHHSWSSLLHLQTSALAHSPLCWRHRRGFWHSTVMHRLCKHPAPPAPHPSTAHSAVPLSEQMTGLIPQVFVTVFDNRLNTKRAAGIIWKKRKQLPGLNGSTVMLAACRLQQRKSHSPKSSWQPLNNPIKQKKWKGNWPQRGPGGKGNSVCPFRLCSWNNSQCRDANAAEGPKQSGGATGTRIFQKWNIAWDIPTGQSGAVREGMWQTLGHWICAWEIHTRISAERSGIADFQLLGMSYYSHSTAMISDLSIPTADLNTQGWDVLIKYSLNRERRPLTKTKCGVNVTWYKFEYQDVPQTPDFLVFMHLIPIPIALNPNSYLLLSNFPHKTRPLLHLSSLIWFNLIKKISPGMYLEEPLPVTAPGVWWLHHTGWKEFPWESLEQQENKTEKTGKEKFLLQIAGSAFASTIPSIHSHQSPAVPRGAGAQLLGPWSQPGCRELLRAH